MARNDVYYYDKNTLQGYLLGEVQDNFNISFVIDGTKDSAKFIVYSFNQVDETEPYTILWHSGTNTWWVVSHDKVEKYVNESGYLFKHELQVLGLIELLNARDLTDCGFYANNYTISSFLDRLLELSNLEFYDNLPLTINSPSLDLGKNIDYTKTFENYTLLNALRELFDGYNCAIKMSLTQNNEHLLIGYTFNIISKTGDNSLDVLNEDDFNSVKETKNMNQNSFGTIVVSNAENVISTKSKTYPAIGTVKLSSNRYEIEGSNARLFLPSNIFKVNWLKIIVPKQLVVIITINGVATYTEQYWFYNDDEDYIKNRFVYILNQMGKIHAPGAANAMEVVQNNYESWIDTISRGMRTTLYTGWKYNPITKDLIPPTNNPDFYFAPIRVDKYNGAGIFLQTVYSGSMLLTTKEERDCLHAPLGTISYQRGNNYLEDFEFLTYNNQSGDHYRSILQSFLATDLRAEGINYSLYNETGGTYGAIINLSTGGKWLTPQDLNFKINYIPMSDIKVKYDNSGLSKDIKLYNQNGKLTDGVALSKLLLSYSKEIEGDTITKFGTYYNENDIPTVGQIVLINSNYYVINNVSLDYFENEDNNYYIVAEFTMSKNISTKSIMTNPNTNVRDYGIPQNLNVKRKQLYRDFYELSHELDVYSDNDFYMPLYKMCNFGYRQTDISEHIAVMKLVYDESFGGDNQTGTSNIWYYQLDTTAFALKKQYYEVLDFKDNNIIGYGNQNVWSGFDIRRVLTGMYDAINTPIQYTDDNGKVKSFNIAMCNIETIQEIYGNYVDEEEEANNQTFEKSIYNYSFFIDEKIYEGSSGGRTLLHEGVEFEDSGTIWTPDRVNITPYLNGYNGNASDLTLGSLDIYDSQGTIAQLGTDYTYQIIKEGNNYYIEITTLTQLGGSCHLVIFSNIYVNGYQGAKDLCDFMIVEENYNKDPIEVPVFEYACQIDDSNDVIIGENILDRNETDGTFYKFLIVNKNTINQNNWNSLNIQNIENFEDCSNCVEFETTNDEIKINFYENEYFPLGIRTNTVIEPTFSNAFDLNSLLNKDIVIIRTTTKVIWQEINGNLFADDLIENNDLMFVIRNIENANIEGNKLTLKINHYKIN